MMRIDDKVRKTVVFVGVAHTTGFVPYGTAFIVASSVGEQVFQTVVTAKHVIDNIRAHKKGEVSLRVNTQNDGPQLLRGDIDSWLPHPDPKIDVSVCASVIAKDQFDILHLMLDPPHVISGEIIQERDIGTGNEVFIAGMYIQRIGQARNLPIVRTGTIAAMPEEKIETAYGYHEAYLIEARSIGGLSGSPVFVTIPPVTQKDGKVRLESGRTQYLLGMLLGHSNLQDQRDEIEIVNPERKAASDPELITVRVPQNTGIGIVLPIAEVRAAVEQPIMQKLREEAVKRRTNPSSLVADVAPSASTAIRIESYSSNGASAPKDAQSQPKTQENV